MWKAFVMSMSAVLLFACAKSAQATEATTPMTIEPVRIDSTTFPSPSDELRVIGQLKYISTPPHCGYFHIGAVAEYTDLKIINGSYLQDKIYVVHGCPELARNEYANASGNLESFQIGDYHVLYLTSQNRFKIGVIDSGDMQLPMDIDNAEACASGCDAETFVRLQDGMMYFSSQVDLYSQ